MESNMKVMNIEEMEMVAAGLRTEMLTDEEKAEYNRLLHQAQRRGSAGEFGGFVFDMHCKYGWAIYDDYERTHDGYSLDHYKRAE